MGGKATAILCAAVIAGAAGPAAHAGTLSASGVTATYKGSTGEANSVSFSVQAFFDPSFARVSVTDEGAPVAAGPGCEPIDAHTARCDLPYSSIGARVNVLLLLNDRADEATAAFACDSEDEEPTCGITIDGGDGNDWLRGGETQGDVVVRGRRGDDRLAGRSGQRLSGGLGRDRLVGTADDFFDSSGGPCTMAGDAGADRIYGLGGGHLARGGSGADLIYGGDGKDVLRGGTGRDLLRGRYGNDTLYGGRGRDLLRGSKGNDTLHARDGERDGLRGGAGYDRARIDSGRDVLAGIERVF
jgi:RTX calcium-binding nonapeptide repeat (4 copies)